jgi:hypothetical protein
MTCLRHVGRRQEQPSGGEIEIGNPRNRKVACRRHAVVEPAGGIEPEGNDPSDPLPDQLRRTLGLSVSECERPQVYGPRAESILIKSCRWLSRTNSVMVGITSGSRQLSNFSEQSQCGQFRALRMGYRVVTQSITRLISLTTRPTLPIFAVHHCRLAVSAQSRSSEIRVRVSPPAGAGPPLPPLVPVKRRFGVDNCPPLE